MTYAEKLRTPRWQKKRLEILQRDGFACLRCKDEKEQIQVHHKKYLRGRDPWDYEDSNFESLCETCHFIETFYSKFFDKSEYPFVVIKTQWSKNSTKVILAYCYINGIATTRILRLNFKRKTIKEMKRLPVNLKPLKP